MSEVRDTQHKQLSNQADNFFSKTLLYEKENKTDDNIIGGAMLFGRFLLSDVWPQTLVGSSTEWMRGPKLCTFRGMFNPT